MKRKIRLMKCCFVFMVSLLLVACGYSQDPALDVTTHATAPAEKMSTLASVCRFDEIQMDGPYVEIRVYGDESYYYTNRNEEFCESLVTFIRSTEFSLQQAKASDKDHIYVFIWDNNNTTSFSIYENDVVAVSFGVDWCYYYCEGVYKRFEEIFNPFFDENSKHCPSASTPIRHMYEYAVFDKDYKLLDSDYISRQPHLFFDSGIVHWWIQAGTGVLTRCAKFFHVEKSLISPMYYGQTDYYGDLVCATGSSKVLVYEMFSGEQVCCFDQFEKPLGDCIENICSAYFIKDGKEIIVEYLNADFEKEIQTFAVPQN